MSEDRSAGCNTCKAAFGKFVLVLIVLSTNHGCGFKRCRMTPLSRSMTSASRTSSFSRRGLSDDGNIP